MTHGLLHREDLPGRSPQELRNPENVPVHWASPNIQNLPGDVTGSILSLFRQLVHVGTVRRQTQEAASNMQALASLQSLLTTATGATDSEQLRSVKEMICVDRLQTTTLEAGPSTRHLPDSELERDFQDSLDSDQDDSDRNSDEP